MKRREEKIRYGTADARRMGNLVTDTAPSEEAIEAILAAPLVTVSPTRGK